MEFSEVLRRRRTVRHDTDQPLVPEVVERVLDAALRAPPAGFSQAEAFPVLTAPDGGRLAVGHRHPHLEPHDSTTLAQRRCAKEDVLHRGRWRQG